MTTSMDLAIYCHMLHRAGSINLPLVDVVKLNWGEHEFTFLDPENQIRKLEVAFANEKQIASWTAAQRSLKSVMRSSIPWTGGRSESGSRRGAGATDARNRQR